MEDKTEQQIKTLLLKILIDKNKSVLGANNYIF